jgi:beta-glucosidase
MGWKIEPEAFHECLMRFKNMYGNPPVYITENGAAYQDVLSLDGKVRDAARTKHYESYIAQVFRAMDEGADIRGYFAWSLLDNFEWACGYDKRFGLVYVDYKTLKRYPKDTYFWYRNFIAAHRAGATRYGT